MQSAAFKEQRILIVFVKISSSVMKGLDQHAIWNYISRWFILVMLVDKSLR